MAAQGSVVVAVVEAVAVVAADCAGEKILDAAESCSPCHVTRVYEDSVALVQCSQMVTEPFFTFYERRNEDKLVRMENVAKNLSFVLTLDEHPLTTLGNPKRDEMK